MSSNNNNLKSSELAVLESIHDSKQAMSQREIARRTGMSVGLINAVIKKLVHTGYIKTSHLNRRSIEYLLTPQGFAEKARKSYHYIMRTVKTYREIQMRLESLLDRLQSEGVKEFYLHGDGDLADLVTTLAEGKDCGGFKRGLPDKKRKRVVVLNVVPGSIDEENGWQVIDLTRELDAGTNAKKGDGTNV